MRSNDVCYDNPLTPDSDSVSPGMEEAPGSHTDGISSTNISHDFIFDKEDGDIELQMNNTLFKTRKYLLNKFSVLAKLVRDAESAKQFPTSSPTPMPRVVVKCDAQLIGDFNNMTKILYASVIEGPFEFDTATLISALRVATVYRYDALRQFSISNLERAELSAIQRIKIAHELDVAHWTEPAFEELANRLEPIQPEEARILGIDALLRVANMREERRARRGGDGNTALSETGTMMGPRPQGAPLREPTSDGLSDTEEDAVHCLLDLDDDLLGEKAKTRFIGIPVPPLRVHVPNKSRRQRLEVDFPDCTCTSPEAGNCVTCRIPPCLFKVLRSLQAQQMISSDEIMALQGTMSVLGG